MKKKELRELHSKTIEELRKDLNDKEGEFAQIKLNVALAKEKNTNLKTTVRKDLARIKTLLSIKTKEIQKNGK